MHEAAIAQSIVRTVLDEAEKQGAVRVESVEIEIGELTFLGTEQVEFWVNTSFQDTIAQGAKIIFKNVKAQMRCNVCGYEGHLNVKEDPAYHLSLPSFSCPKCKSTKIEITRGREAVIRQIKIIKE